MNQHLEEERLEHNKIYDQQKSWLLDNALSWEAYYQRMCRPPHLGGTLYGFDHQIFLDHLLKELSSQSTNTLKILDYGCGTGALAIALATRGYHLTGFDLSDKGIEIAKQAALKAGVAQQTDFRVANAQALPFDSGTFDLIIGKAVLHHTIKYEHTEAELFRILKPKGKVLFFEGAATNPLISLARKFTLKEELGDVPLTIKKINKFGKAFRDIRIEGFFFLYMLKRFGYYSSDEGLPDNGRNKIGKTIIFRYFLKMCLAFDEIFVNRKRPQIAGRYLIHLEK